MKEFIAATVQMAIIPGDVKYNLKKISRFLNKAVKEFKAELVVFPETITTGFAGKISPLKLWNLVDRIPGRITHPICKLAKKLKVHVVLPTYERGPGKGVIYNSAVLIDSKGEIVGVYRKNHLFPVERKKAGGACVPGDKIEPFKTSLGTIGIMICYDGDFPEISRILAIKGAEIIVRPAALLRSFEIWDLTNRARAYDNHVYVIGAGSIGPDMSKNYHFGHSMIVSPLAQKLALARGTEEIIAAKLDLDPIKYITYGSKSPMEFDHLLDRNLPAYKDLLKIAKSAFNLPEDR